MKHFNQDAGVFRFALSSLHPCIPASSLHHPCIIPASSLHHPCIEKTTVTSSALCPILTLMLQWKETMQ
jgi:hypothetical protein